MQFKKFRWSKVYESSEEELQDFLDARDIEANRWAVDEFHETDPQTLEPNGTLWCAEGSFTFRSGNASISMQPGDSLQIPAGATFSVVAGMSGCVCYQS